MFFQYNNSPLIKQQTSHTKLTKREKWNIKINKLLYVIRVYVSILYTKYYSILLWVILVWYTFSQQYATEFQWHVGKKTSNTKKLWKLINFSQWYFPGTFYPRYGFPFWNTQRKVLLCSWWCVVKVSIGSIFKKKKS